MVNFQEKEIKKADSENAADSNGTYIIDDYLKFVKGNKKDAKEVLLKIEDKNLQSAVLEHIAMRYEKGKDKQMTARAIKWLLTHLDNVCSLQGIENNSLLNKVKVAMLNKATNARWLSIYPLSQTELNLIKSSLKSSSFDENEIKRRFNVFD